MAARRDLLGDGDSPVGQLALLVGTIADYAIFLLDREGHVITWNPGAERAKGYTAAEIVGEHFSVFYTPEDRGAGRPRAALETAAREGRYESEGWRVRKDGTRFWADVVITALRDADGRLVGFGKVTRDLTERHAAREELELFASSAAHDLQEPLRTVSGFTGLLERRFGDLLPAEAHEYLHHMAAATERMQRLIVDLLAYARSGRAPTPPQPVALVGAVRAAVDDLAAAATERGVQPTVDLPDGAAVMAEPVAVAQVVRNLLANALKFADATAPEVAVSAERADGRWRVVVADNGAGVPEDKRAAIFEPFTQLRRDDFGGTGLGLSICRRLVARHGGTIGVQPRQGGGSAFWFELPAA